MRANAAYKLWKILGLSGSPVALGQGLFGRVIRITPAIAKTILEQYNNQNRKMKARSAEKYAGDMAAGRWQLTHEGIAFNDDPDDPNLADGQNRLKAIEDSKKSQHVLVVLGLKVEAVEVINEGVKRNANDAANILGLDYNKQYLAVVRNLHRGWHDLTNPMSNSYTLELAKKYKSTLKWVNDNMPSQKGVSSNALLMGVLCRVYLSIKADKGISEDVRQERLEDLKTFMRVLGDGQWKGLPGQFENASRLRDYLMSKKYGQQRDVWGYCEVMVLSTLAGDTRFRFTKAKKELITMPWDKPQPVKVKAKKKKWRRKVKAA